METGFQKGKDDKKKRHQVMFRKVRSRIDTDMIKHGDSEEDSVVPLTGIQICNVTNVRHLCELRSL